MNRPAATIGIAAVVKRPLHETTSDVTYWRSRPYEERLAMVEELRGLYHGWESESQPRLQRVHRILKRV